MTSLPLQPSVPMSVASFPEGQTQLLQAFWESVTYGILVLDVLDGGTDFRYAAFNPAIAQFSPIPGDQLIGKRVTEVLPPEKVLLHQHHYSTCVKTGQSLSFKDHIDSQGHPTEWLLTLTPLQSPVGDVDRLIVTILDISNCNGADRLLQEPTQIHPTDLAAQVTEYAAPLRPRTAVPSQTCSETPRIDREDRLPLIMATIPGAVFQFCNRSGQWSVDYISHYIFTLSGLTPTELQQDLNTFFRLIHPDDLESCLASVTTAVETLKPWRFEGRLIKPTGELRWWQGESIPTLVEGEVIFCGLLTDITDRKTTEFSLKQATVDLEAHVAERTIELQQQKDLFQLVLDSMSDGVMVVDAQGQCLLVNPAAIHMFGAELVDVLEKGEIGLYEIFLPGQTTPCSVEQLPLVRALSGHTFHDVEMMVHRVSTGEELWALHSGSPLKDREGHLKGGVVICRDITESKQAEKEQSRLLAILEATSDFVSTADPNGEVLYFNQAARQMLGLGDDESFAGRSLTQNHPAWVNQLFFEHALPEAIRTGRWVGETALLGGNGQEIPLSQLILSHKSEDGEVEYFSTIARDISQLKRQENALRFIVEGTVTKSGDEFFQACVQYLADICQVQYAFITEVADDDCTASTMLALWTGDGFVEPYTFDLKGTPCSAVFQNAWGIFPNDLQARFPEADALSTLGAESYLGVAIVNAQGKALGNLGIIDTKPLTDNLETAKFILQIFAGRVGTELERKAAEAKLQEQEQFLRTVYEGADQPVFVIDVSGHDEFRYIGWNAAATAASGMTSEEISGKTSVEIYGTEAGALENQRLQACLTSGTAASYEECLMLNGRETWWITTYNPIQDSAGKIYRFVATTFDITERKAAEAELQQTKNFLESILHNLPVGVFAKDAETLQLMLWNSAAEKILKLGTTDVLGKTDYDFFPEAQADYFTLRDRQAISQGKTIDIPEEKICTGDGEVRILHTQKTAILDPNGKPRYLLGITEDITERKAAEYALKEYASRQTLLNQLASQIRNSLDLDTVIETTIQAILSLLNIDQCCFAWFTPETEPPFFELFKEAKLEGVPSCIGTYPLSLVGEIDSFLYSQKILQIDDVEQYEEPIHQAFLKQIHCKSEILVPVRTHADQIGVIICVTYEQVRAWTESEVAMLQSVGDQLAIAIDQAELYAQTQSKSRELEQALRELQRTQAQVVQSEKMSSLGQLVAGIAHEINNPVNFIHGNLSHAGEYTRDLLSLVDLYQHHYPDPSPDIVEVLEEIDLEFLSADLPKLLSSMQVGTERIREIVKSLRIFSRLDEAEIKSVDLHEGIDSTLMILHNRLKARSDRPEIQVVKEYGSLPKVECYAGQLNQVFMNILVNAIDALEEIKFQPPSSDLGDHEAQITISTALINQHWVEIAIADNGAGIPPHLQERIFDPFFTTKPVGKGTGMGMSISYQIVTEKHNGTLECVSTVGKGTQFIIRIPMQRSTPYPR